MSERLRINLPAVERIESALEAARMTRCSVPKEHQDAMRVYLESWVAQPLESALEIIRGERRG